MNDLNQVNLIGRLGADVELRYTPSGQAIANARLACNWSRKKSDGTYQEGAEWISIAAFGRTAEILQEYTRKGSRVFVSGRFHTREWEKNGEKRFLTEIVVTQLQLLDPPPAQRPAPAARPAPAPAKQEEFIDDDIPFAVAFAFLAPAAAFVLTALPHVAGVIGA